MDPSCTMCGLKHETTIHTLLFCDFSKLVWHESFVPTYALAGDTFPLWFSNAMSVVTEEDLVVVVALLYHIWRARNSTIWERFLPRPMQV